MRIAAIALFLLTSFLLAETQEDVYFRALKAEETGDVVLALRTFQDAFLIPGPYTDEIQDIIDKYNEALADDDETDDGKVQDLSMKAPQRSVMFRSMGDIGQYWLHYNEFGDTLDYSDNGVNLFMSTSNFVDIVAGNWIHSFGVAVTGDFFFLNTDMPVLDTNDWSLTLGLEYTLVGKYLMIDVGADLNLAEDVNVYPSYFGWLEVDFAHWGKQRFGSAYWGYYNTDGPVSAAAYLSWHRGSSYGWNADVFLGYRMDADSIFDYKGYVRDYEAAFETTFNHAMDSAEAVWDPLNDPEHPNPFQDCIDVYGVDSCFAMYFTDPEALYNLYWKDKYDTLVSNVLNTVDSIIADVPVPRYYAKWMGPNLRSKFTYKFKSPFELEMRMNLFYGFVLDGPDEEYKKIKKFTGNWGGILYWKPGYGSAYVGFEQIYRYHSLPDYYKGLIPQNALLFEIKAGVRWDI